jgi:hypothetical protein
MFVAEGGFAASGQLSASVCILLGLDRSEPD